MNGYRKFFVTLLVISMLLSSCSSDELDNFGACVSGHDRVKVYAATGEQQYARMAVIIDVTVPGPPEGFDLSEANLDIDVRYKTANRARNSMCTDVSSSSGGEGIIADAVAGHVTTETKFDGTTGVPSEIRVVATGLVFDNGHEEDQIRTDWLEVCGMPPASCS